VDVNLDGRAGDLTIATLTPGATYLVRMAGGGRVQRIAISTTSGNGVTADAAGVVRVPLNAVPRVGGIGFDPGAGSGGTISGPGAGAANAGDAGLSGFDTHAAGAGAGDAASAHPGLVPVTADTPSTIAEWNARITKMLQSGDLRVRETAADAVVKGRTEQRLTQLYKGVPVFGGQLTRTFDAGRTVGIAGALYADIDVDPAPTLTPADAAAVFDHLAPGLAGRGRTPELIVLPIDDGRYALTYRARIPKGSDIEMTFIDAETGEVVLSVSDIRRFMP